MEKIIAVVGPTASGKTALAIEIAKEFNGEVVSCDSMQIYKHMDIGTAKPTIEEQQQVKHHMIDIVEPYENYSVAEFTKRARECIDDVVARGKVPIVAGGTGLYFDSIVENIVFPDIPNDPKFREEMIEMADLCGNQVVHDLLAQKDPQAAAKIHPNNLRRVIRALEICHVTGRTFTAVNADSKREPIYDTLIFGLDIDREFLYDRINNRVDQMLAEGLLEEVQGLRDMGIDRDTTAMQAIGYKEFLEFLDGRATYYEAVDKIKMESRRYAKRQLTWFRRNSGINWVEPKDREELGKIFEKCFTFLK
ncbi:MAG: tRNA (adenosine(37)-N6)-dimethylallyltransferase MiaA [Clostridia bacterium]|nr:tRNA (adenosine(37)-N6)-dimethylallyltransferase MiaA [Clostridia bacterium]